MHRLLSGAALAVAVGFTTSVAAERPLPPPPQRVIVQFEGSAPGRAEVADEVLASVAAGHGVRFEKYLEVGTGAVSYWIRGARSDEQVGRVIEALARSPRVAHAERSRYWGPSAEPNDPEYVHQWHYREPAGINLPLAWDHPADGTGVVVAVVDTGILPHEDLANVLPGYDMIKDIPSARDGNGRDGDPTDEGDWVDDSGAGGGEPLCYPWELCDKNPRDSYTLYPSSWHGTHVTGTVAAMTNNGLGVAGVAFNASILPVRALGVGGGTTEDIADSILWAAGAPVIGAPANSTPAAVINLSLGGVSSCSPTFADAIASARALGANVVVSAGNGGPSRSANENSPGNCPGAFTVAALNRQGVAASYASLGSVVEIAAPGGQMAAQDDPNGVLSTSNTGTQDPEQSTYKYYQGSSMAAPHVSGVLALVRSLNPTFTVAQAEQRVLDTARAISCSGCNNKALDATAAVTSGVPLPLVSLAVSGPMAENGGTATVTATLSAAYSKPVTLQLSLSGTATLATDYSASATSISIPAGQTSGAITLTAIDDGAYEGGVNETVTVAILEAVGTPTYAHPGTPRQVTTTITNDDARSTIRFTSSVQATLENSRLNPPPSKFVPISVTRSGNLDEQVTVKFSRSGGTATSGSDFVMPANNTLTFLPGQATASFQIEVINDSTPENEESITLVLSNPSAGATIGSPSSMVLWINCNDGYPSCS
jgi:serine protease